MALTTQERNALPASSFAVPDTRELPIHDVPHVKMAWSAVDKLKGLTDDSRADARRRILAKAHEVGVDTRDWHLQSMSFSAMALQFPETGGHTNKLPFEGVLTLLDVPSDKSLFGTGGKKVILPSNVAEAALGSLLGMAIDFTPEFDGHSPRNKIGIITSAEVDESKIQIKGYFYANDFPAEVQRIQAEKDDMGFSFEAQSFIQSMKADPLVVSAIEFTGAAVLYKASAAYQQTSISAHADQEKDMTPEQEAKLKAATDAVAGIPKLIADSIALALKAASDAQDAASKKAAKEKADKEENDRLEAARKLVAGNADQTAMATAITGAITAAMKPVTDVIDSLKTQVTDLKTTLAASSSKEPQRKTLSPSTMLVLQRVGLNAGADGKTPVKVTDIDAAAKKANLSRQDSMALKLALKDANLLEAAA